MNTGELRVSRWVLVAELLLCFSGFAFWLSDVWFGAFGLTRLDREAVDKYFLGLPGGTLALTAMCINALATIAGAIALVFGLQFALFGRRLLNRVWVVGLAIVIAAPFLFAASTAVILGASVLPLSLEAFVLLFALPLTGLFHVAWLSTREPVIGAAAS